MRGNIDGVKERLVTNRERKTENKSHKTNKGLGDTVRKTWRERGRDIAAVQC